MFRLHFPSLFLLMLSASILLGANVVWREPYLVQISGGRDNIVDFHWASGRGWPYLYQESNLHQVNMCELRNLNLPGNAWLLEHIDLPVRSDGKKIIPDPYTMPVLRNGGVVAGVKNGLIALLIMGMLTAVTEFLCRKYRYRAHVVPVDQIPPKG